MQNNRQKDDPSERRGNQKPRGDRNPIEERVNQQSDQNRISLVRMHALVGVGFFSTVKSRSDGVLEEMDKQVSPEDEKPGIPAPQMDALRHHFDQRRRQHETCSERDEVAEVGTLPMLLNDDGAAEHIRARRRQAQQQTRPDGRHEEKEYQVAASLLSRPGDEATPVSTRRASHEQNARLLRF